MATRPIPSDYAKTKLGQRRKAELVAMHGNRCLDCGFSGPPFAYDFDHREPLMKRFEISKGYGKPWAELLAEVEKCDMVCANCHRLRTHRQRCPGCVLCATPEAP